MSGSEALEEILESNFDLHDDHVMRLVNQGARLAEIEKAIRSFGPGGARELEEADQLILSFAGHGDEDHLTQETAFIPYDGDPDSPSTWFRFEHLRPLLRVISARHILVISDSCFSGGVFRSGGGVSNPASTTLEYARRAYAKRSRSMISSGGIERTEDGGGRLGCSVFIDGLIHSLRSEKEDWILTNEIFSDLRNYVVANAEQTPEFGPLSRAGHGGGEFIFFQQKSRSEVHAHLADELANSLNERGTDLVSATADELADFLSSEPYSSVDDVPSLESSPTSRFADEESSRAKLNGASEESFLRDDQPVVHLQNWNAIKEKIKERFGSEFELLDEVDISEFWQILNQTQSTR